MFYIKMWKVIWFIGYVLERKVQDFHPLARVWIPISFEVLYLTSLSDNK